MAANDSLNQSFEAALESLEKIVEQLESGELSLEDSLAAFEAGVGLVKQCNQKLNEVEPSRYRQKCSWLGTATSSLEAKAVNMSPLRSDGSGGEVVQLCVSEFQSRTRIQEQITEIGASERWIKML